MEMQGQQVGPRPVHMGGSRMPSTQQLTPQQQQAMMAQQQHQAQIMMGHSHSNGLPAPAPGQGPALPPGACPTPVQGPAIIPGNPPTHHPVAAQQVPQQQLAQAQAASAVQDNISRAKSLMPPMRESIANIFKTGAEAVYSNTVVDCGSKPVELDPSKFDKALEEFYSICDHMELNLKAAMECISQGSMSQQNLSVPVSQTKMDGSVSYPQCLSTVINQISFAKEVHDVLADAAQNMLE